MDVFLARSHLKNAKRIVIKIGTNTIIGSDGAFNKSLAHSLAEDIAYLRQIGHEFIIVSSGAIGLGNRRMGWLKTDNDSLVKKQCAASIGQAILMRSYQECFETTGLTVSQLLLTYGDLEDPGRISTVKALMDHIIETGIIAVINENDSVSAEEITFGDNDILSARISCLVGADLLVILSNIDGFYKNFESRETMSHITAITPEITQCISKSTSGDGTGGMTSKIIAAKIASDCGAETIIAKGTEKNIIKRIFDGEDIGTLITLNGGNGR